MVDHLPMLKGEQVLIRQLDDSDVEALFSIFGDPVVTQYMGIPQLRNITDANKLFAGIVSGLENKSLFQWGIVDVDLNAVVGTCTLAQICWTHQRAEIGFALGSSHWGRGLMRQALPLLISYAFESLDLHRLEADIDPRNQRSLKMLQRLGFQKEGYFRQRHQVHGERQDSVMLGLLADEWSHD